MTALEVPTAELDQQTHTLYRMFNSSGELLYVGITGCVPARMQAHRKQKFWWGDVVGITLEHFGAREDLEAAEVVAIRAEDPVYNVMARTDPKPSTRKTPQRTFAIEQELWDELDDAARKVGYDRPAVLRQFMRWYVGKGQLPQRPDFDD